MGNKHFFARQFAEVLRRRGDGIDTIVDLFGGSGLLSRIAKDTLPQCRVIYNDYDNYAARLAAIPATNKLLAQLRDLFAPVPHNGHIPDQLRDRALQAMEEGGATDIATIGAAVLFSGRAAATLDELKRQRPWYNRLPMHDYTAEGYLDGLEVVREDWRTLYNSHGGSRTLFVCDPPYLTTQANNYKGVRYWQLAAYLDILLVLRGARFIYFTSGKSQLVELCSWLARHTDIDALAGTEVVNRINFLNACGGYTDIMIFN